MSAGYVRYPYGAEYGGGYAMGAGYGGYGWAEYGGGGYGGSGEPEPGYGRQYMYRAESESYVERGGGGSGGTCGRGEKRSNRGGTIPVGFEDNVLLQQKSTLETNIPLSDCLYSAFLAILFTGDFAHLFWLWEGSN